MERNRLRVFRVWDKNRRARYSEHCNLRSRNRCSWIDHKCNLCVFVMAIVANAPQSRHQSDGRPGTIDCRSDVHCLPRDNRRFDFIASRRNVGEIAAHCLQRVFFCINFAPRANSFATEDWHWRAPSLDRVLKQKGQNDTRNRKELLVHQQAQHCSRERERGGVYFEPAFDVPFVLQLVDSARNYLFRFASSLHHPARGFPFDFPVHIPSGIRLDSVFRVHTKLNRIQ